MRAVTWVGIATLLVLAANEPLSIRRGLKDNHRAVREVASEQGAPVAAPTKGS